MDHRHFLCFLEYSAIKGQLQVLLKLNQKIKEEEPPHKRDGALFCSPPSTRRRILDMVLLAVLAPFDSAALEQPAETKMQFSGLLGLVANAPSPTQQADTGARSLE